MQTVRHIDYWLKTNEIGEIQGKPKKAIASIDVQYIILNNEKYY